MDSVLYIKNFRQDLQDLVDCYFFSFRMKEMNVNRLRGKIILLIAPSSL
jgi:hypothetical protein